MRYMSEKEYEQELKRIKAKNKQRERKRKLREEQLKALPHFKFKKPRTSKMVLWTVIIICIQILWFSEHMASVTGDTSFMYALVAIPASLIPTVLSYMKNSRVEHQMGQFENSGMEILDNNSSNNEDNMNC